MNTSRWGHVFQREKPTVGEHFLPIGEHMGEVVRFVSKRELERARLIDEARALYESIFPTEGPASKERDCSPGTRAIRLDLMPTYG